MRQRPPSLLAAVIVAWHAAEAAPIAAGIMLLPLGDSPNPRSVAYVTYAILLLNAALFVLLTLPLSGSKADPDDPLLIEYVETVLRTPANPTIEREQLAHVSAYDLLILRYGFRPAEPTLVALLTSLFLHAGFLHLFGNLLVLWIYGDNVEYRLGRIRYLGLYFGGGIAATLTHALVDLDSTLPLIGASGAISAVLGAYFIWFPHNRVRLFVWLFPFIARTVMVPARLVLGLYLIVDNLLPFLVAGATDRGGVAHGAHIGGFLVGVAVAWWFDRLEVQARPPEFPADAPTAAASNVENLLRAGDFEAAAAAYFALPAAATRGLLPATDSLELGTWLRQAGHPHAALVVFRRHLRDYPRGPGAAEAHLGAGLVQLEDLAQPTPAYQHFLEALECKPQPETVALARRALATIEARRRSS